MKKLLNNPRVVAVLAVMAIGFVAWSLREQLGGPGIGASPHVEEVLGMEPIELDAVALAEGGPGRMLSIPAMLAALVLPSNLADPFVRRGSMLVAGDPVIEAAPVAPDHIETIQLTAVWKQGAHAFAVVNGRIMRPGEALGRLTIDAIGTDGVWVSHWRGRDFLSFGGEFTLATPASGPPVRTDFFHEN